MRRYAVLACLLLLTTTLTAYEQQIQIIAAQLTERLAAAGRKKVAVVDFTDLQGNTTELGRFLAEELSVALSVDAKGFSVIDRTHLKAILQENKLAASGVIDPQTARQLGKIAGVDSLVTGTITPFGDSVRLSVKALDTQTADMIAATAVDVPKTKAVEELLARSVGAAVVRTDGKPAVKAVTSPSAGSFQNDFLTVTVDSVGFSKDRNSQLHVSLVLSVESRTAEDDFLAYATNSSALTDGHARSWNQDGFSGLPGTYNNPPRRDEYARVPPGVRHTVILSFWTNLGDLPSPTAVSFSMTCWRLHGNTPERFSIGLSRIPVGQ